MGCSYLVLPFYRLRFQCKYMTLYSMASWFAGRYRRAIFYTAVSTIISWPFAGLIGLPIAIDMVFMRKDLFSFVKWSMQSLMLILAPMMAIEYYYYGKMTLPTLNIILYNVFSSHGPDLYGTEPFSFYIYNGFLNFNIVYLSSLVVFPICVIAYSMNQLPNHRTLKDCFLVFLPMYLWFFIFFCQSHKEERFLFPVYPLICLAGAVFVDSVAKIVNSVWVHFHWPGPRLVASVFRYGFVLMYMFLSIARILAILKGFSGSISAYKVFSNGNLSREWKDNVNVCVGKEWHRFPSSFLFFYLCTFGSSSSFVNLIRRNDFY
ncbi:alpha-1,2-mannosyltransferase ALG9-like, partial [Artemia franciscana]|uniref:alpha-1,2-mannosyltransferase ALG9-like n=1 Tax=Artemia franciscana TaxID=6661 RepID=UPI0032D9AEB6